MQVQRISGQKPRRKSNSFEKRVANDEYLQRLSQPRKMIKLSGTTQDDLGILEYSKIPQLPEIKLTKEDMNCDPIELFVRLQKQYEDFGAVKIITPPEWKPPFCFTYGQIGIKTRVQHLHKLKLGKVIIFQMECHLFKFFLITQAFKENQQAYNVKNFQAMAQDFQKSYRIKTNPTGSNIQDQLQSEYWNLVHQNYEGPQWKFKTSVEYAADLPVVKHGSGFPLCQSYKSKDQNFDYYLSLFNLNNIYKSPNSILKIAEAKKQFISGVTTPWVYMGMLFSTFCWHVEDLWLNSLNYNHKGGVKLWYVIPRKFKQKFDRFVTKKTGRTDLLDRITFMIDPLQIMKAGIPVYKVHQNPGEYVCTFFKAYHAGFSLGFNIGEAVNFASPVSLSYIEQAMNFLANKKEIRPAVLSLQWLIYENKIQSQINQRNCFQKIVDEYFQRMVKEEQGWLNKVAQSYTIQMGTQIDSSCKYDRNSCSKCRNYQYLSSLRCLDCKRNYCSLDFVKCCSGKYELVYREPNEDRRWILSLENKKKQI